MVGFRFNRDPNLANIELSGMSITTHNTMTERESASLESWREFVELSNKVSRIPKEKYWAWAESPEGIEAMVQLISGTLGEALKELEKN